MHFQHKIIINFAIMAIVLSMLFGGIWYYDSRKNCFSQAEQNLLFVSEQMLGQYEAFYKEMNQVTTQFLAGKEVFEALHIVREQNMYESEDVAYYTSILEGALNTSYNLSNFFRVIFFNSAGVVLYSSMDQSAGIITEIKEPLTRKCVAEADNMHGKAVVLPAHEDEWNRDSHKEVISLIRGIQGKALGYIEVQQSKDVLEKIFKPLDNSIQSAVFLENGDDLYVSEKENSFDDTYKKYSMLGNGIYSDDENKCIVSVEKISGNAVLLLKINFSFVYAQLNRNMIFTFGLVFIILVLSIIFIFLASSHLTKPIRNLKKQIDEKALSDLEKPFLVSGSSDELVALSSSYHDLLLRLYESMEKNQKLSVLQLQAQFDSLQAQINPHFLYNILNVMANRGVENGDEVLCGICKNLAAMLRYSTDTVKRYATVAEELEYLNQYIYLMKTRYEEYLEVNICAEESTRNKRIPKLTLQQLVENSIKHGYVQKASEMKISVTIQSNATSWLIQILDNGDGFSEKALEEINKSIEKMKYRLEKQAETINMQIGGMGILNLYGRLYLLYSEKMEFSCKNVSTGGAMVEIKIFEE